MIKMIGNYTRPEELLTKLVNENTNLKKEIKELKEENMSLRRMVEDHQQVELEYADYYSDEENTQKSIELANERLPDSDIVTYEEWFNTNEESETLAQAYRKYYNI